MAKAELRLSQLVHQLSLLAPEARREARNASKAMPL